MIDDKIGKFDALFSSVKSDWETPDFLFRALDDEFGFTVDVCATWENKKMSYFFSPQQDAFRRDWKGVAYMNPPYSRGIDRWLAKAIKSVVDNQATVVCLVPSRTDTNWWFDYARLAEVRFLKGRLQFEGGNSSAPFPSALLIYRPGLPQSTGYWQYEPLSEPPYYRVRNWTGEPDVVG